MYLSKQEVAVLKVYQKYRHEELPLVRLLLRCSRRAVVLLIICLVVGSLAMAPGGSPAYGWCTIGFLGGLAFCRFNGALLRWQLWPLTREVTDWEKVEQLIRENENRTP